MAFIRRVPCLPPPREAFQLQNPAKSPGDSRQLLTHPLYLLCLALPLSPSLPPSFHLCPFTDGSHSWTKRGALSADQNEGWKEREREKGRVEKKKDTSPLFEQARVNTGVRQNRTGKARELQTDTSIFMSRFPFHVSSSSPDD